MPQQLARGLDLIAGQTVDRRIEQRLTLMFRLLRHTEFGPAPATGVSAIEHGAAERAAIHRSGLKVEQQVLQLTACVLEGSAVSGAPGVPDHLDQIDDFSAILIAAVVQFRVSLR
jgi:hypothetical protein